MNFFHSRLIFASQAIFTLFIPEFEGVEDEVAIF